MFIIIFFYTYTQSYKINFCAIKYVYNKNNFNGNLGIVWHYAKWNQEPIYSCPRNVYRLSLENEYSNNILIVSLTIIV